MKDKSLYNKLEVKCKLLEGHDRDDIRVCGSCDACVLQSYTQRTVDWFSRASESTKKMFLSGLARRMTSPDLIAYMQHLLTPVMCKDYTYSRSRSAPGQNCDQVAFHGDRTLDLRALEQEIYSVWTWFGETTHYAKINYMLELLKLCDSHLLMTLQHQLRAVEISSKRHLVDTMLNHEGHQHTPEETTYDSDASDETYVTEKHPDVAWLKATKGEDFMMKARNPLSGKTFARESRQRKAARARAAERKREPNQDKSLTAHRSSKKPDAQSVEEIDPILTTTPFGDTAVSGLAMHKDFIRELPVFISKYILNFLDKPSLVQACRVSKTWKVIAGQVVDEGNIQMKLQEQYTVLQGSSAKGCNPVYAKDIVCLAPEVDPVDKTPRVKPGYTPADQDFSATGQITLESAYFGFCTRQIYVEEKNIFCGSYNTLILATCEPDANRIVHFSGGGLIALASDKKLQLVSVEDGKAISKKPITGHAGSIQCAFVDDKEGYVLTGSYDTSVRVWDIETGACRKIFRGHTDSIFALTKYLDTMVTGSKDCTVKVWDITKGCVTVTFRHKDPVLCVEMGGERLFSGDQSGVIKMWDLRYEQFVKELIGHAGPVLCLHSDKWHLVSGGKDGSVLLWSTVGTFTRCLGVFRHPKPVMNVYVQDMRALSGCMDGKMRIWNLLTGDCLRLLRGNSRSEPIYHMWPVGDRIIINTLTNVLALKFEAVDFDYGLDADRPEVIRVRRKSGRREQAVHHHFQQSHAYLRAQKMRRVGSAHANIVNRDAANDRPPTGKSRTDNEPRTQRPKTTSAVRRPHTGFSTGLAGDLGTVHPDDLEDERSPFVTQRSRAARTLDSSEAEAAKQELEGRRRNSGIAGTIQENEAAVNLTDALVMLRAQKRQTGQHNVSQDQIFLTVNMIKNAVNPEKGEKELNTLENFSLPHTARTSVATRPSSAPYNVDPRQKTLVTEFSHFKTARAIPRVATGEEPEQPRPSVIKVPLETTVLPKPESRLMPEGVRATIPPITIVRPRSGAPAGREAATTSGQEKQTERPVSTAGSSISRKFSPMVMKQHPSPGGDSPSTDPREQNGTRKATRAAAASRGTVVDPLKQFSNFSLKTTAQWEEYERDYLAKIEQSQQEDSAAKERQKHRRWLLMTRANTVF